ncbi:MAG: hypothetical protein IJ731_09020 [Eubacterium sp.]|nr:hypothetical protein [Eubacterium sp.]
MAITPYKMRIALNNQAQLNINNKKKRTEKDEENLRALADDSEFASRESYARFLQDQQEQKRNEWNKTHPFSSDYSGYDRDKIIEAEDKINAYEKNRSNSDFAKRSTYSRNKNDENLLKRNDIYFNWNYNDPDVILNAINENQSVASTETMKYVNGMSDKQKSMLAYIYNTQGKKEASKYLESLEPILNAKQNAENQKMYKDIAQKMPVRAEMLKQFVDLGTGVNGVLDAATNMFWGKIDLNDNRHQINYASQALGEGERARWNNGKEINVFGTKYNTGELLYDVVDSTIHSAVMAALGSDVGGAVAGEAATQKELAKYASRITTMIMGSEIASNKVKEELENGEEQNKAVASSILYGVATAISEGLALEKVFGSNSKNILKKAYQMFMPEALEEIVENWLDRGIDLATNNTNSPEKVVNQLMSENNISKRDAIWAVLKSYLSEDIIAGAQGGISGVAMGSTHSMATKARLSNIGSTVSKDLPLFNDVINVAFALPSESKTNSLIKGISKNAKLTDSRIGELYVQTLNDVQESFNDAKTKEELEKRANFITDRLNSTEFSAAVSSMYLEASDRISKSEQKTNSSETNTYSSETKTSASETESAVAVDEKNNSAAGEIKAPLLAKRYNFAVPVTVNSTGNETVISSVHGTKGGALQFSLPSGETVSASEITASSPQTERILNDASDIKLGAAGASFFIQNAINKNHNQSDYISYKSFAPVMYDFGKIGLPWARVESLQKEMINQLGYGVAKEFYAAGVADQNAVDSLKEESKSKTKKTVQRTGEGTVTNYTGDETLDKVFKTLADKLHINIEYVMEGNENGSFNPETGTLRLVQGAVRGDLTSLAHEIGEYARAYNHKAYKQYVNTLINMLFDMGAIETTNDIFDYYRTYNSDGETATLQQAKEELANDVTARLFFAEGGIEEVVEYVKGNDSLSENEKKSFFETLKDLINHIVDIVKEYVTNKNLSNSEKAVANMSLDDVQKLRKQFLSVLDEAISNLENGVEVTLERKYSLNQYTEHEKKNWKASKTIVVCETEQQIEDFCNKALSDKTYKKKAYFGAVSEHLAAAIKANTGLDTTNLNCCIKADEVRKVVVNSHGDEKGEADRGQRPITINDIVSIPVIVQSPDEIRLSKKLYEGKPVIEFVKTLNGRTTVISYVSRKHMDLSVQTMYSGKNKGSLATTPSGTSPFSHTSETLSGTTSKNSVPQNEEKSNTKKSLDVNHYMTAAENGDEETAQKYVDEAAMKWGAYSIDGKTPLKLYHGTPNKFNIFEKKKIGSTTDDGVYGRGFYFSTKRVQAEQYNKGDNGRVIESYLKMNNPLKLNNYSVSELAKLLDMDESQFSYDYAESFAKPSLAWAGKFTGALKNNGFDGVIVEYSNGANEYIVFDSEQIKSADPITYDNDGKIIPLDERFTESKDIRYSKDVVSSASSLLQENKKLAEMVDYWKRMAQLSKQKDYKRRDVRKKAIELKKETGSKIDTDELTDMLFELFTGRANAKASEQAFWDIKAKTIAEAISDAIPARFSDEKQGVIDYLKGSKISLSEYAQQDVRAMNDGKLRPWINQVNKLVVYSSSENGTPLNKKWGEWSSDYPWLFDEKLPVPQQPIKMLEIIEWLYNHDNNDLGYDEQEYIDFLSANINKIGADLVPIETMADKEAKKRLQVEKDFKEYRKGAMLSYENAIEAVQQDYEKRLKKQLANQQTEHNTQMGETVQDYQRLIADMKADFEVKYKDKLRKRHETVRRRELRESIERNANMLYRNIYKPTKKNHIPDALREPVLDMFSYLNFEHGVVKDGEKTKHDTVWQQKFLEVADVLDYVRKIQSGKTEDISADKIKKYGDIYLDVPAFVINELRSLAKKYLGKANIYEMATPDLEYLAKAVRTLRHTVSKINQLHQEEMNNNVHETCSKIQQEIENKKGFKGANAPFFGLLYNFFNFEQTDFFSFIKLLGKTGEDLIGNIYYKGFTKQARLIKQVRQFSNELLKNVDYKTWTGDKAELNKIKTQYEGNIYITPAQAMSLYLLNKRGKQAMTHILEGSSVLKYDNKKTRSKLKNVFKSEGKTISWNEEAVRKRNLTYDDVVNIIATLTDEQKVVADKIGEFLSKEVSKWGNEVTMELYLYSAFMTENYFPIETPDFEPATNDTNASLVASMWGVANQGFTNQTTEEAKTAIYIDDIFSVFARHTNGMINFASYTIPVTNAMKFINYRSIGDENAVGDSMKYTIEKKYGRGAIKWFTNFIQDINGFDGEKLSSFERIANKMTSNAKVAAVGANTRVAIQQVTAYTKAYALMDAKYLNKALSISEDIGKGKTGNNWAQQAKLAKEYCPIAYWKSLGYFETDISRGIEDMLVDRSSAMDRIKEKSMILAELGDEITWAKLFTACQLEVADKQRLKLGTEECYQAAGERLTQIINETQVVDSVFHSSELIPRNHPLIKGATAFMNEATKSYNMLRNAVIGYNEGTISKKQLCKTVGAYITTQILVSIFAGFVDAFRHKGEDDENFWKRWLKWSIKGGIDNINPFNLIPFFKDAFSVLDGWDVGRMDMTAISTLFNAGKYTWRRALGESNRPIMSDVYVYLKAFSQFTGLPIANAYREIETFAKMFTKNGWRDQLSNSEQYKQLYEYQISNDTEKYKKLYDKLVKNNGTDEKTINSGIKSVLVDNDINVAQAAVAYAKGKMNDYIDYIEKIKAEGFDERLSENAVSSYYNSMQNAKELKDDGDEDKYSLLLDELLLSGIDKSTLEATINEIEITESEDKTPQLYSKDDLITALDNGESQAFSHMKENMLDIYQLNGKSQSEAKDELKKSIQSGYRQEYIDNPSRRSSIESKLNSTGLFSKEDYTKWTAESYNSAALKKKFESTDDYKAIRSYIGERINAETSAGQTQKQAEKNIRSDIAREYKEKFINGNADTKGKILTYMQRSGLYGSREDCKEWIRRYWYN